MVLSRLFMDNESMKRINGKLIDNHIHICSNGVTTTYYIRLAKTYKNLTVLVE